MMKTLKNIISATLFSLSLFCMTSCEEDKYTPGPTVTPDNMGVYFAYDNEHEIIKGELDDNNIQIKLMREITTEAASVPIQVLSQNGNLDIPATAEFKAGEAETYITVTYKELVPPLQCELTIPLEYTNPYKIKNGSTNYSVSIHRLVPICENVRYECMSASDLDIFSNATSSIYQMEGENQFIWYNFMGSDINLKFKIDGKFDKENIRNSYGNVVPINHYYHDGEWGWYLTEEENGNNDDSTFKAWLPEGSENGGVNEYMFFYDPYEGYSYFYIDFQDYGGFGYGTIESCIIDSSDNYNNYYFYINY